MSKSTGWYYAKTVNEQVNPNNPKRNHWKDMANAVGNSSKTAYASFTRKKKTRKVNKNGKTVTKDYYVTNYPYTVTAHEFGLNIPSNAYINKVEIQVRMRKTSSKAKVEFPRGVMCIYGVGWSKHLGNTKSKETGWHNGLYLVNPKKQLATTHTNYTYTISGANISKAGFKASHLNSTICGIDLIFDDEPDLATNVRLEWVRIRVDYDVPTYKITHNGTATTYSNPRALKTGNVNSVTFILEQSTNAYGGNQCLKLDLPYGVKLNGSVVVSKGSFNSNTNTWNVNCDGKTKATLSLQFKDYTVDTQSIKLYSCTLQSPMLNGAYYFRSGYGGVDDFGTITTQSINTPHYRHDSCFAVASKVISTNDTTVEFQIFRDSGLAWENLSAELDPNISSDGVTLTDYSNNTVTVTVPQNEVVDVAFRFCVRPLSTGEHYVYLTLPQMGAESDKCYFTVKEPYVYHFGTRTNDTDTDFNNLFNDEIIEFVYHRIASQLETGAYVLPCGVKEGDADMIQAKSNIHMYKYDDVDYIGCVPLEHTHFDPESTYKDKLLDSHYKNKRYMGKQLASDETITLNVRLHPPQVTTVQGLIDMDKPIPVNTNHKSFEGDSLNHRGWAEIYGISTTRTNPHWYKCKIDLKYLTHNLNTRFKIKKGNRSFNYNIPSLLAETFVTGEALSENQNTDYFLVDTDGTYVYNTDDSEIEEYKDSNNQTVTYNPTSETEEQEYMALLQTLEDEGYTVVTPFVEGETIKVLHDYSVGDEFRNEFNLDEGQHITIRTRETIGQANRITFSWASSLLTENKENHVSRITQLIDKKTNNVVFEYEYEDYSISDNGVSCHVIGRRLDKGDYEEVINKDIELHTLAVDEDDDVEIEDAEDVSHFGSTLTFTVNNNIVSVEDTGVSGKEINVSNIELEGESYYWQTRWVNNNTDGEDSDINSYFDLTAQDTLLETQYGEKYKGMYVSPFPVANKKLIFTREAEEGVIYYFDDDEEEVSYLIDPYYQYQNGVDLRSESQGSSIFNLNYGYTTVYLENGLVSMGINRLTGQMYLRKWDNDLREYVTLFRFQLTNYNDVNINSISDDKIELQASNTIISMYRGHPYVILKHRLEDVGIIGNFKRVWAENVGKDESNYPVYYDLLNSQNLLPSCIGGVSTLEPSCITKVEDTTTENNLTDVNLVLDLDDDIEANTSTNLNVTGLNDGDIVHFLIDGDEIGHTTYPTPLTYTFTKDGAYEITGVFVGDNTRNYAVSGNVTVHVKQQEVTSGGTGTGNTGSGNNNTPTGAYKLEMWCPSKMTYLDNSKIRFRLTRGGQPVNGKTIEKSVFTSTWTSVTGNNGYVGDVLNNKTNWIPKKYKIGARFYQGAKLITSVFKDVTVVKASTKWELALPSSSNNHKFVATLKDEWGNTIKNQKVTVYVDGKKYSKKTNNKGQIKFSYKSSKKTYTFKLVFGGNTKYKKVTKTQKVKF